MNLDLMKEEIKQRIPVETYLDKSKYGMYICPFCESGTGKNGTGAVKVYKETNTFSCHKCKKGGDVILLYRNLQKPEKPFLQAVDELGATIGLFRDEPIQSDPRKDFSPLPDAALPHDGENTSTPPGNNKPPSAPKREAAGKKDFMAYYEKCFNILTSPEGAAGMEYLENVRKIPLEVALPYNVGFDPKADPAGSGHPAPRIIIPTSKSHYIARSISDKTPDAFKKMNPKGSSPGIFNIEACYRKDVQEVFILEGAIDALSVMACGYESGKTYHAIATNSTSNRDTLLKMLAEKRPPEDITFIICMDNDDAGRAAASSLADGFRRIGLKFIKVNISGKAKDANEAWTTTPEALTEAIEEAIHKTSLRPDNVACYIDNYMGGDIEHFKQPRKTGFPTLDREAGGLYPGLYVLAAITSLGKTTLALQMADNLAAAGEDVLFFSLEMSKLDLVAKSLSRTVAQMFPAGERITSTQIRKGKLPAEYAEAVQKYKETVGDRLSIVEANFDLDISSIGDYIRGYMAKTKTHPTIFIDYLQIIQPQEDDSKKQRREALDNTVAMLKRLSREIEAPVIVVSSVNRINYLTPIAFESLKETGGIEYSADVIWGLQLQCLNESLFDGGESNKSKKRERIEAAKKANPRKIELKCLKNRYGVSSFSVYFEYRPDVDLFVDTLDLFADTSGLATAPVEKKTKRVIK